VLSSRWGELIVAAVADEASGMENEEKIDKGRVRMTHGLRSFMKFVQFCCIRRCLLKGLVPFDASFYPVLSR
jgi:hypothetical protein